MRRWCLHLLTAILLLTPAIAAGQASGGATLTLDKGIDPGQLAQ